MKIHRLTSKRRRLKDDPEAKLMDEVFDARCPECGKAVSERIETDLLTFTKCRNCGCEFDHELR